MRTAPRLLSTLQSLGFALRPIASLARNSSPLDQAALANAYEALDLANDWRRDTRQTTHRLAYGAACKCFALARAPVPTDSEASALARHALATFAAALFAALEGDHDRAVIIGDTAANIARPL